jgi:hypothetical protein
MSKEFDIGNTLVAVMSFNRGEYLQNCVSSIERHITGVRIVVFDDCSFLPDTRRILADLAKNCEVIVRQAPVAGGSLGGLYMNMNYAMEVARKRGLRHVFFVQDDQQIVRTVDERAVAEVRAIFAHDNSITHIHPIFMKGYFPVQISRDMHVEVEDLCYLVARNADGDTGIVDLRRLETADFRYCDHADVNKTIALNKGLKAVSSKNPFFMHTPWPETIRPMGWKGRALFAVNHWGVNAGCNPFCDMDAAAVRRLVQRPISDLPIADVYLKTHRKLKQPWFYSTSFDRQKILSMRELLTLRWIFDGSSEYMDYCNLLSDEDWRHLGLRRPLLNRLLADPR